MTTDFKTNYDVETNTSDVEKTKKQTELRKETEQTCIWLKSILVEAT